MDIIEQDMIDRYRRFLTCMNAILYTLGYFKSLFVMHNVHLHLYLSCIIITIYTCMHAYIYIYICIYTGVSIGINIYIKLRSTNM